jgi:hypothetical protein
MEAALLTSDDQNFNTSPDFLDIVRKIDAIGLDPATDSFNRVGAKSFFTPERDGLVQSWQGYGLVFCNPPYGRSLGDWSQKFCEEGYQEAHGGAALITLTPARTDTRWFRRMRHSATAVCLMDGRQTFYRIHPQTGVWGPAVTLNKKKSHEAGREIYEVSPAPFPSAVFYWGDHRWKFREVFQNHGWVIEL